MLLRLVIAAALSFIFATLAALWLQYLPGPVLLWQFLLLLDGLALLPLIKKNRASPAAPASTVRALLPLLFILLILNTIAIFIRMNDGKYIPRT